ICVFVITSLLSIDYNAGAQTGSEEEEARTSVDVKKRVQQFLEEGEINDDQAAHALKLHLTAVGHYEKKDETEKVIKHMRSFISLLDHQRDNEQISEKVHQVLEADANALLEWWDAIQIVTDGEANAVVV